MNFKKIAFTGIVLAIGLACAGCQTPVSSGQTQKSPSRFVEEPDTDDFVADQLRNRATNFYNEKY